MSTNALTCPKCTNTMSPVSAGGVTVDRCEACGGIWLDSGERKKLLESKQLARELDTGSATRGGAMDQIEAIDCPKCGTPMDHMQHPEQRHIGFEFCRTCSGSFFDAGELVDLSEYTIAERIQSFFKLRK